MEHDIIVNLITKMKGDMDKSIKAYQSGLEGLNKAEKANIKIGKGFNARFQESIVQGRQMTTVYGQISGSGNKMKSSITGISSRMRPFRMEMLSVMFAGMAMQRVYENLTKTAKEWTGATAIQEATLGALYAPWEAMKTEALLPINEALMNMPDSAKIVVGAFTELFGLTGKGLAFFGQFKLGMDGLKMLKDGLPVLGSGFKNLVGPLGGASKGFMVLNASMLPILIVVIAIIAVIALLWWAWKNNFGNIREHVANIIAFIKSIFEGFVKFIRGIIDVFVGILTLNPELIMKGFRGIIDGAKQIFKGFIGIGSEIIEWIVYGLKAAGHKIWDFFSNLPIIGPILKAAGKAGSWLAGLLPFAEGGIVTGPTPALIGEAGPEAVIPLDKLNNMGTTNITINASVRSDSDIDMLVSKIESKMRTRSGRL